MTALDALVEAARSPRRLTLDDFRAVVPGAKPLAFRDTSRFAYAAFAVGDAGRRAFVALRPSPVVGFQLESGKYKLNVSIGSRARAIDGGDLAGYQLESAAVLFHTEPTVARSALWFETTGERPLEHIVTGLAPGSWQTWRNGWLDEGTLEIQPQEACLAFSGLPGSYFLRRLG